MTALRLIGKRIEKPWGRRDLPPGFGPVPATAEPVGEIIFEHPDLEDAELLVKYLFTSERLSIQVHPDDEAARRRGYPRGKDEAWVILSAGPGAEIGIGTRRPIGEEELKAAALDGSIEQLVDWRAVKAGDVFYSPAGTIHTIGLELTLIEIQQNMDVTYRLYDYGRPRELHLEDAVAVANAVPYAPRFVPIPYGSGRVILADGPKFVLEQWNGPVAGVVETASGRPAWLIPVEGTGSVGGDSLEAGAAWMIEGATELVCSEGSHLLIAYPGPGIIENLLRQRQRNCPYDDVVDLS